jgi:hypothetical protein
MESQSLPDSPRQQDSGTRSSLTRVTANFTPRAAALDRIAAETGDSKTDILNRSVMVYEAFLELMEQSGGNLRVVHTDGSTERLWFIG